MKINPNPDLFTDSRSLNFILKVKYLETMFPTQNSFQKKPFLPSSAPAPSKAKLAELALILQNPRPNHPSPTHPPGIVVRIPNITKLK